MTVIGEVLQADTAMFTAQSVSLSSVPALGSCVRVGGTMTDGSDPFTAFVPTEGAVYGLVVRASTGSFDSGRKAMAVGLPLDELEKRQPQIFELLRTEFVCVVVGFCDSGGIVRRLPPAPVRIHDQVFTASSEEAIRLTEKAEFLRPILCARELAAVDEVAAAAVRLAAELRESPFDYKVRIGRELTTMLRDDFDRLAGIVRKLAV